MKVLHVSHGCLPDMSGGVETYLDEVIRAQVELGLEVELLAGSHELRATTRIESTRRGGVPVHRLYRDDLYFDLWSKSYCASAERAFDALLADVAPDVVHVHQWIRLTSNLVEIAARRGIPAVVTTHDVFTSCPRCFRVRRDGESCLRSLSVESCLDCVPRFGHEVERELALGIELYRDQFRAELGMAAKVLVADPATRDVITESTEIPAAWFDVEPLPYARRFGALAGTPPRARSDRPIRFAYWGVLTYRKGAQVLARAFRELCDAGLPRPAELHLFGGVDTPELANELALLADGAPIVLHGRYEYADLGRAGIDMGVFPMLCFETWGFVLDECFELGLPCITTENGALARRAGGAALRVPQGSVGALRKALERCLLHPELLVELQSHIPPLPPTHAEHAVRLQSIYGAAIQAGPNRRATPIDPLRRLELLTLQRESATNRVIPPGGPR